MKINKSIVLMLAVSVSGLGLTACGGGGGGGGGSHATYTGTTTVTNTIVDNSTNVFSPGTTTTVYVDPSPSEPVYAPAPSYPDPVYAPSQPVQEPTYQPSQPSYPDQSSSGGYDSGGYNSGGYDSSGGYDDGGYDDSGYNGGGSSDGCDASGCNSFGAGGSKSTGLLATKVLKAQVAMKAASIASQFEMSLPAATKLVQLAAQVKGMKQQKQLTQADRDAAAAAAFKIAGVTQKQVTAAVSASLQTGNQAAIEDVMNTAAQNLGMPSGATFRDKLLPIFGN